jgi:hypothetical protein
VSKEARFGILAVVAVLAFGVALLVFRSTTESASDNVISGGQTATTMGGMSANGCPTSAGNDTSYKVVVESQPTAESKDVTLVVTRDGKPLSGATVCVEAAMSTMAHEGINGKASELSAGRYQVKNLSFTMRGGWSGTVFIEESGRRAAAIPVAFDVQ